MLCNDANLLVHAYLDNELDAGDSVQLSRHLAGCPSCAATLARHGQLRDLMRKVAPQYRLPDAARARVLAALPLATAEPSAQRPRPLRVWRALPTALAASVLLLVGGGLGMVWQQRASQSQSLSAEVLSDHLRSLQAQHLTDVATSDQHTVKPWFDGKLDYSPQVRDLAADGFVLVGGRLDVLQGRRVGAIVYRRRLHAINLFQWPGAGSDTAPNSIAAGDGFALVRWTQDGMDYCAVSNLGRAEMDAFVAAFRAAPPLAVPPVR
jgi:anti-sigma factor RsiW